MPTFRKERNAKNDLSLESFFMNFGAVFSFSEGVGNRFCGFSGLGNRLENREIFGAVTDSKSLIWRGGSTGYLNFRNS